VERVPRSWLAAVEAVSCRPDTTQAIKDECDSILNLLLQKNSEYGDSVFFPKRIFSRSDAEEQLRVRIDDKLSRLMNQDPKLIPEDTEQDLIGYLILLRVARKLQVV